MTGKRLVESDPRFTPDEARTIEDGCRAVFEAADRAGMRWRLDEALAEVTAESGGTLADAMASVLRKWFSGEYPSVPQARLPDAEGVSGIRSVLKAYGAMEVRTCSVTGGARARVYELPLADPGQARRRAGPAASAATGSVAEQRGLRFLREVALTTGHRGVSARHEVAPEYFQGTSVLLASALEGSQPRIRGVEPACVLDARASGPNLLVTIARVAGDGGLESLVTVGIAPGTSRQRADALWRRMHRVSAELATRADEPPIEPWCASRLEPGLFAHPEVASWIGCLRQCLAWTWVRYVEEGKWPGLH